MPYAEVAVNAPGGHRATFSYAVPDGLDLQPGHAVWVPFGPRTVQGIVMGMTSLPAVPDVRPILSVIGDKPVISASQVDFSAWLAGYYLCPLFDAVALFLPPGFERHLETSYELDADRLAGLRSSLDPDQLAAVSLATEKGLLSATTLRKVLGAVKARKTADRLVKLKAFRLVQRLQKPKVSVKIAEFAELVARLKGEDPASQVKHARRQAALLEFLATAGAALPVRSLLNSTGVSRSSLNSLVRKGLVSLQTLPVRRDPLAQARFKVSPVPVLNPAQCAAVSSIIPSLEHPPSTASSPAVFCLFGITGSGKTEVYLRLLGEAVSRGKRGICLVPEISLTPQAVERFHARFPGRVAIIHSHLTPGEQYDEWRLIENGDFDVVVGPRSALFAPQPDLGLIVLDEEHEWTYKQADKSPRYHARTAAIELAQLTGATLVLGSATPDVETFYATQAGRFRLLELPERVTPLGNSAIASIDIIDQRQELKQGNTGIFSRAMENAVRAVLERGEQAILFLNRRGAATLVACAACGYVARCPRCGIALTYHAAGQELRCHRCHQRRLAVRSCPSCGKPRLRFLGVGTEAVESEAARLFPGARLLRWDSDSAAGRHSHETILTEFSERRADILIGTQMLAKGLDLPGVTLAGVMCADTGLNVPDFRASERTFQLLCQVAGRVGRGEHPGRVIIQTYAPDNYAIIHAARQDYRGFYAEEIAWRRSIGYPPFRQLIRLTLSHSNPERCRVEASRVARDLAAARDTQALEDIEIIGPQPAPVSRLRGRWRWQLTLAGSEPSRLLRSFSFNESWALDVDPIGVL
jgi:primosomal protein N' (replication factor Y)